MNENMCCECAMSTSGEVPVQDATIQKSESELAHTIVVGLIVVLCVAFVIVGGYVIRKILLKILGEKTELIKPKLQATALMQATPGAPGAPVPSPVPSPSPGVPAPVHALLPSSAPARQFTKRQAQDESELQENLNANPASSSALPQEPASQPNKLPVYTESEIAVPVFGNLMYAAQTHPKVTRFEKGVLIPMRNRSRLHLQHLQQMPNVRGTDTVFISVISCDHDLDYKLNGIKLFDSRQVSLTGGILSTQLPAEWNPTVEIYGMTADEIMKMYVGVGMTEEAAKKRVMEKFDLLFEASISSSLTGFNADISGVSAVGKPLSSGEVIVETYEGKTKIFTKSPKRSKQWTEAVFDDIMKGSFVFCVVAGSEVHISGFFESSDLDCRNVDVACLVSDCDGVCENQQCIASTNGMLNAWVEGGAVEYLKQNYEQQHAIQTLLGIKTSVKQKPWGEVYDHGPSSFLNVLKVRGKNIESHTSTSHPDYKKRLLNTFVGNSMGVYFNEGGFVSIEFPNAVHVNCAAVSADCLEGTPVLALFGYKIIGNQVKKTLLLTTQMQKSNVFHAFEFHGIRAKKFELHVTHENTGFTYARLGNIRSDHTYTDFADCNECGGVTSRVVNGQKQVLPCPVHCEWVASEWSRCNSDCLQKREVFCGKAGYVADVSECKEREHTKRKEQKCYVDDCISDPGTSRFYEAMVLSSQRATIPYRLMYKNQINTWNWSGGQKEKGEVHCVIMAVNKIDFRSDGHGSFHEDEIMFLGGISVYVDPHKITVTLGSVAVFDEDQTEQSKNIFIAILAKDPPRRARCTVSVCVEGGMWKSQSINSEWFPGTKSVVIGSAVYRLYWYANEEHEIPIEHAQEAAKCLLQC